MRYDTSYVDYILKEIKQLPDDVYDFMMDFVEKFQRQTFKLLENERAMFDRSCKQSHIALGNMMTTAALMDIDSCPTEGFDPAVLDGILTKQCGMDPVTYGAVVMCAFGYRAEAPRQAIRRPMEKTVRWIK